MTNVRLLTVTAVLAGVLLWLAPVEDAQALLAEHDCSFCHELHGAPGFNSLLNETTTEAVCLTCHAVSINDTAAAAVHNPSQLPSTDPGYITCRDCHDAHDNILNADGNFNIKLIGIDFDPETDQVFNTAVIREGLPGDFGPYKDVIFEVRADTFTDFHRSDRRGVCAICHPATNENEHGLSFLEQATCTNTQGCHPHGRGYGFEPPP